MIIGPGPKRWSQVKLGTHEGLITKPGECLYPNADSNAGVIVSMMLAAEETVLLGVYRLVMSCVELELLGRGEIELGLLDLLS